MKKRIICVVLTLAAVFSLFGFEATQAWFSDGKNKTQTLQAGALDFSANGSFSFETTDESGKEIKVLPGMELGLSAPIEITNTSTIDSELRIKIECMYNGEAQSWLSFVLADDETSWKLETEEDGYSYIYYRPNGEGRLEAPETEEGDTFTFDGSIAISGKVPYELQNQEMTINLVLQAKQADFMVWENFYNDNGMPAPEIAA